MRILASCLFFSAALVYAQPAPTAYSIHGRVLDETGAAVPSAEVRLYHRLTQVQTNTRTNADGLYRFERLAEGEYLIQAQAAAGQLTAEPTMVEAGKTAAPVDLRLRVTARADRVTVTAAATPESLSAAGKTLDVLDRDTLEARNEITLIESLRFVPGLRIQQLGGPGSFSRIQTRGLRAADTGLLVDGMRFRDAAAVQGDATGYLGDLQLIGSERIEVLRGLGSAIYGSNATAGVINIVTDQGGGPLRGEIAGEGGGLGLGRGSARLAGGALGNRLNYSGGAAHLNVNGGVDGVENVRNSSAQGYLQWRPSASSSLSGRSFAGTSTIGVNSSPQAAPAANLPPSGTIPAIAVDRAQMLLGDQGRPFSWGNATFGPNFYDPDSRRIGWFSSTMAAWQHQAAPRFNYRLSYQNLLSSRDNRNGPAGSSFQPRFNNSSLFEGQIDTLQGRADFAMARWQLLAFGYEFEREWYRNLSADENPDPAQRVRATAQASQRSHSLYFSSQTRLLEERLQLHLTGRYQNFHLSKPAFTGGAPRYDGATFASPASAFTGDASLSYLLPKSSTRLRAHAGNGYRAPTLYERIGTSFFFGSFSPLGDPGLRPERTVSFDFGADQYLARDKVRLGGTYFYTRLQEVVGYINLLNDPWGRFGGYAIVGGGLARGAEFSAEFRPTRGTTVQSTYTYTNADERRSALVGGLLQSIRVFPHSFTAQITRQVTRRLQVAADFLAASDYISGSFFTGSGNRPYLFEGPRKLDLAASYAVPAGERRAVKFTLRIENALNQRYFEDGFRTPRAWASAGMKFTF